MKKIYLAAAIVFLAFVGLAWAVTPPPPPPPPVGQNIGLHDTGIDNLVTTGTDQTHLSKIFEKSLSIANVRVSLTNG